MEIGLSTRSTQDVRDRLQRLSVYASLVLLLAVVSSVVKVVALNRQDKLLDRSMCEVTQKVVGKCYEDFAMAESVLRGRGTVGASIPRVSAAGVLAELAARSPGVQLRFDRIEITREKLHLQGTTDPAENVERIVGALRGSRCFGDARSGGARRRGTDQKFEFTVDADITCEGAPVFEGIRCYSTDKGPAVFRLQEYAERLTADRFRARAGHTRSTVVGRRCGYCNQADCRRE